MRKTTAFLSALVLLAAGGFTALSSPLAAQEPALANGSAGLGLLLRRLDGVKRVLLIGAHPDDEDTSLLAALSRGMGVETAYLSLTRGEGGQNLLGDELDEGLGLLRTGELLAARSLDGGTQYFSRAFDFGYSKTAEETFRYWPRDEILADVTWVVRTFRPQVIVSIFSGTPRDGHGQHQVAGMMAKAVFETAGDPDAFPEQLEVGALPWSPRKLYLRSRFGPGEVSTEVETGRFDPLLGRSHYQLAMESRSQHRSQDMGMPQPPGPRSSGLILEASRVPVAEDGGPEGFFAGVDTTLTGLATGVDAGRRGGVEEALRRYDRAIVAAQEGLEAAEPWGITEELEGALDALRDVGSRIDDPGDSELAHVLAERIPLVERAILLSEGVVVDARVNGDFLVPGEDVGATVSLWNGGPRTVSGAEAGLMLPKGWTATRVEGPEGTQVAPGSLATWAFDIHVPRTAELSQPYFLEQPRDGEIYRWPGDPALWGMPRNPPPISGRVSLRLGASSTPLTVAREAVFVGVDKATGQYTEPVLVVPRLSVSVDPDRMVWPTALAESREVTVRVKTQSATDEPGVVTLTLPEGWQTEPREIPMEGLEPGAESSFTFRITPPEPLAPGEYAVQAQVRTGQGEMYGEGFVTVDYPHIRRNVLFSPSTSRISAVPVSLEPGLRVGYIMGSGDMGAEVLSQLGASVKLLDPEDVRGGAFDGLDVLVLGIRAYETRPDVAAANDRILDFARDGGTVIVQYNKYEFPQGGFAPYPVTMSRPHDRVADETVPVTILDPTHPLFNYPNKITQADFQGWAQERGLYFLHTWDEHYTPLLEMHDPGEEAKRGGLVVTPLGKGLYVYTGLAFFRQFPEGVPGAYRLFANLVSLKGSGENGA